MTPSNSAQGSKDEGQYSDRLLFLPSALKEWLALDGSVKEPLRKLLQKRLNNPHVPGGELHGELKGYYKIKLNKQGIRLVYGVEDDVLIVMVMAVDRREDGAVYRSVLERMGAKAAGIAAAVKSKMNPV